MFYCSRQCIISALTVQTVVNINALIDLYYFVISIYRLKIANLIFLKGLKVQFQVTPMQR